MINIEICNVVELGRYSFNQITNKIVTYSNSKVSKILTIHVKNNLY